MYYLAGPMTGLPEFNYPAFREACAVLRERGYTVRSPHEMFEDEVSLGEIERPWWEYLSKGIRLLMYCTDIIMLPDWEMSAGATLEKVIAQGLGMGSYLYEFNTQSQVLTLHLEKKGKRDVHNE